MKHLGNISNINGAEIDPVDLITFGSPCQDLSVAGKRAGLKHTANGDDETTRSGLFMEAVRIIKEMREATNGKYPRFALWENVPGAFSSNKGEDFRIVCEELIKIVEKDAVMPEVPKTGWPYADCYSGDGWSLAYRTFDTQYWPGTPQRRRRIHLVADFSGECAKEILFEREGLRRDYASGKPPWERTTADAENSAGTADSKCYGISSYDSNAMKSANLHSGIYEADTSRTLDLNGGNPACNQGGIAIVERVGIDGYNGDVTGNNTDYTSVLVEQQVYSKSSRAKNADDATTWKDSKVANTLNTFDQGEVRTNELVIEPVYCVQGNGIDRSDTAGCNGKGWKEDTGYTLNTVDRPAVAYATDVGFFNSCEDQSPALLARGYKDPHLVTYPQEEVRYTVRRLTPTECARLQGFADDWGHIYPKNALSDDEHAFWLDVRNTHASINGKKTKEYTKSQMLTWYNKLHSDSAEYKMWGNGIALPPALYCMQGIADVLKRERWSLWEKN